MRSNKRCQVDRCLAATTRSQTTKTVPTRSTNKIKLRDYQRDTLVKIEAALASDRRAKVLLHLATGAGKTTIFSDLLFNQVYQKGLKGLLIVHGKKLVKQAHARLEAYGIKAGIIMADETTGQEAINVASIDTVFARKMTFTDLALIVVDEVHQATSKSYSWFFDQHQEVPFLGVSATPKTRKPYPLVWTHYLHPVSIKDLISKNHLVPMTYYAPTKPNLRNVAIDKRTGDYVLQPLAKAMKKKKLYASIIASYQSLCAGKKALCFAVSVSHAIDIAAAFNKAGIKAAHLDASFSDERRAETIAQLESGAIQVLVNVGLFTTGVDIPCLEAIILARPTRSYNLYTQIIGRGTRTHPGKKTCLVLDHSDCVVSFGFIENERTFNLDQLNSKNQKEDEVILPRVATCFHCYGVYEQKTPPVTRCPLCDEVVQLEGAAKELRKDPDEDTSFVLEKLEAITLTPLGVKDNDPEHVKYVKDLVMTQVEKGYARGWVFVKINQKYKYKRELAKTCLSLAGSYLKIAGKLKLV